MDSSRYAEIIPAPNARAWLEHIPAHWRSTVANWFHFAVRAGAQSPEAVLQAVRQVCERRLRWRDETDAPLVLDALDSDPGGARVYAASVLRYERLPLDARCRVKAERSIHFLKTAMIGKPATGPQLAYLQALGYAGELPSDRAQVSALIDALRQGRGRA